MSASSPKAEGKAVEAPKDGKGVEGKGVEAPPTRKGGLGFGDGRLVPERDSKGIAAPPSRSGGKFGSKQDNRGVPSRSSSDSEQFSPLLSGFEISNAYLDTIWIDPYNPMNMRSASYNVTLGESFFRKSKTPPSMVRAYSATNFRENWEEKVSTASVVTTDDQEIYNLSPGTKYVLLAPGETIVGHTAEFIGTISSICPFWREGGTLLRAGISVKGYPTGNDTANLCKWTLLITNTNSSPAVLAVGFIIGTIYFLTTGQTPTMEAGVPSWTPEDMFVYMNAENREKCGRMIAAIKGEHIVVVAPTSVPPKSSSSKTPLGKMDELWDGEK